MGGETFFGSFCCYCWDCEKRTFCACTMPRLISTPPSRALCSAESYQERLRRCRCDEEELLSFIFFSFRHCVVLSLYDGDLLRKRERRIERAKSPLAPPKVWEQMSPVRRHHRTEGGWKILLQLQTVRRTSFLVRWQSFARDRFSNYGSRENHGRGVRWRRRRGEKQ